MRKHNFQISQKSSQKAFYDIDEKTAKTNMSRGIVFRKNFIFYACTRKEKAQIQSATENIGWGRAHCQSLNVEFFLWFFVHRAFVSFTRPLTVIVNYVRINFMVVHVTQYTDVIKRKSVDENEIDVRQNVRSNRNENSRRNEMHAQVYAFS